MMSSRLFGTLAVCLSLALAFPAAAQELPVQAGKSCDVQANDRKLKGKERHAFLEKCHEQKPELNRKTDACEKEARKKHLDGAARKAYVKNCESAS